MQVLLRLSLVAALVFAACGSDGGGAADVTDTAQDTATTDTATPVDTAVQSEPLTIVSRAPDDGATIAIDAPITVTFSAPIDAATVTENSFTVTSDGGPRYGELAVDGAVVTFTPSSPRPNATSFTVTLGADIATLDGRALGEPDAWGFTTLAGMHVTAVEPEDGATRIHAFDAVRVTFDAAIDSHTVNAETFQVRTSGWVDGVYYDGEAIPASDLRVILEGGATVDDGPIIQWYSAGGIPEYGVRVDVVVTRGVRSADGAALDEEYTSSFYTDVLDPAFYYQLSLEGLGDDQVLGLDGDTPVMTEDKESATSEWYVIPLNNGRSYGLWNRGAQKALTEAGVGANASVAPWAGQFNQAWDLEDYGGRTGTKGPHQSYKAYYLHSGGGGEDSCLKAFSGGVQMDSCGGNIYALWYFTRTGRK